MPRLATGAVSDLLQRIEKLQIFDAAQRIGPIRASSAQIGDGPRAVQILCKPYWRK